MAEKSGARNKREFIIEIWEKLDCESVGAPELTRIQQALVEEFREGAVESPASIARILADEGAGLRHPEVFDLDTTWRRDALGEYVELNFASLSAAANAIHTLEQHRSKFQREKNARELARMKQFVNDVREDLSLIAHSKVAAEGARAEAREILEWLSVWQRAPELFPDWVELRVATKEFIALFPDFQTESP